jgi:hypothetical protein
MCPIAQQAELAEDRPAISVCPLVALDRRKLRPRVARERRDQVPRHQTVIPGNRLFGGRGGHLGSVLWGAEGWVEADGSWEAGGIGDAGGSGEAGGIGDG